MRILVYSERARRAKRHRGALGLIDRDDRAPARPRPPTRRLAAAGVVMLAHAGASALPGSVTSVLRGGALVGGAPGFENRSFASSSQNGVSARLRPPSATGDAEPPASPA